MGVTLSQIARESGVSIALVSRLLSGDRTLQVRDETRQRVLATRERLGWSRPARRTLAKACHIAVPINRIFTPESIQYSRQFPVRILLEGVEAGLRSAGGRLSLTGFDYSTRLDAFRDFCDGPAFCDGLLLLKGLLDEPLAERLHASRKPRVSVEYVAESLGIHSVIDHAYGGFLDALDHLVTLGHRRIGYLGPRIHRYGHFIAAKLDRGLPVEPELDIAYSTSMATSADPPWRELSRTAVAEGLARGLTATALVCHNDRVAQGALDALQARSLTAGRDLSIVGYDNIEEHGDPPAKRPQLTTIDHSQRRVGERCAALLLHQIADGIGPVVHERVPVRFIVRFSTGPALSGRSARIPGRRRQLQTEKAT